MTKKEFPAPTGTTLDRPDTNSFRVALIATIVSLVVTLGIFLLTPAPEAPAEVMILIQNGQKELPQSEVVQSIVNLIEQNTVKQ